MATGALKDALAARDRLTEWLFGCALPLWAGTGTDWINGGFYETIKEDGNPSYAHRRTRVVGRQIFTFATAGELGWSGPAQELVLHGIDYLLSNCLNPDGSVMSVTEPGNVVIDGRFNLYDQAFALFGLAAANRFLGEQHELRTVAEAILKAAQENFKHPLAGFEESSPPTLPLKANPHMHMFEACLAWEENRTEESILWRSQSDEIGNLALSNFIRPDGTLREFFDNNWQPSASESGRIVEPGHQFEWAWLLWRWDNARNREVAKSAAIKLAHIAERYGVDHERDLAIMEIWDDRSVKDNRARLWQQTERIKCWLAIAGMAIDPIEKTKSYQKVARAAAGLERYLDFPITGGAYEIIDCAGMIVADEARASSMYHIICAVAEMHRLLDLQH
jgi:mannose-6-phosphate isomerase